MAKLKTPFADLLPPLSTAEQEALKADIKANGVRDPIVIDEDGNILDGHHRYAIDKTAKTATLSGLSEAEKKAFVYRTNHARRNLSIEQRKKLLKAMKVIAKELREQDAKKYTNKTVGATLGVSEATVSRWMDTTNLHVQDACTPDARVKVPAKEKAKITDRVEAGETQKQVAADYGVTQQRVSGIVTKERKQQAEKAEREAAIVKLGKDTLGIHHGDFRDLGKIIKNDSVDLIFTDPPYEKKHLPDYGDLSAFAARVLRPGGWCLAYSGQTFVPEVIQLLGERLTYGWTFAIRHMGGDQRIHNFKVRNGWKPIFGFYKPPLKRWWNWMPDIVGAAKEKDTHPWQQAVGEAEHFVRHLCPEGGLVVDCFAGGGTTAIAALRTSRQCVCFEIDKEYSEDARTRLAGEKERMNAKCSAA